MDQVIEQLNELDPLCLANYLKDYIVDLKDISYEGDTKWNRKKEPWESKGFRAFAYLKTSCKIRGGSIEHGIYKIVTYPILMNGTVIHTPMGYHSKKSYLDIMCSGKSRCVNPFIPTYKSLLWILCPEDILNDILRKPKKIKFIDLFCGLGAFHTAFNSSPEFQCVLACDINENVRDIYNANFKLPPRGDIRDIDIATMPDFDILCAGFPCQPFSIAGKGEGFKDTVKGNLFYDILNIIDEKTPSMCILENVRNLKTHDNGNTYTTIDSALKKRGYHVTNKVINSAEYGSPQARHRIFIVATKGRTFTIPSGTGISKTVSDIITATTAETTVKLQKYDVISKSQQTVVQGKPHCTHVLCSKATGKGGRQGERIYDINATGITVCASSGGPGAKTGLYMVGNTIRRLNVKETLGMFGFPQTYKFMNMMDEEALFCLGNSIVVNVLQAFVPKVKEWFE